MDARVWLWRLQCDTKFTLGEDVLSIPFHSIPEIYVRVCVCVCVWLLYIYIFFKGTCLGLVLEHQRRDRFDSELGMDLFSLGNPARTPLLFFGALGLALMSGSSNSSRRWWW